MTDWSNTESSPLFFEKTLRKLVAEGLKNNHSQQPKMVVFHPTTFKNLLEWLDKQEKKWPSGNVSYIFGQAGGTDSAEGETSEESPI